MTQCYSTGGVNGSQNIGGLVGTNYGIVTGCYSAGAVSGGKSVGGLAGFNGDWSSVTDCYSTGLVTGKSDAGGLVGSGSPTSATACFWDTQSSDQGKSAGGAGLTTAQMQDIQTYLNAGWDWLGEMGNGICEIWQMPKGGGYPVLAIFNGYTPPRLRGSGTAEDPYLVSNALELGAMVHYRLDAHYRLTASIDLSGIRWGSAVIPWFAGTFDGNGHTISHLTIRGGTFLGLFGQLVSGAEVKNLGLVDVNIVGSGNCIAGLAGSSGSYRFSGGNVVRCFSTGAVSGSGDTGGLVGYNTGPVSQCYSTGVVTGTRYGVGGLVGGNGGPVTESYSTSAVSGADSVGGLVGHNCLCWRGTDCAPGAVTDSYSTGAVNGTGGSIGGLVGDNFWALVTRCYSTGAVTGGGGLVGDNSDGSVELSFWDIQTSGQAISDGGTGKTTARMHTAKTFLDAGWDFVGETANGAQDIWWILEGKDYPRLWWELPANK